MAESKSTAATAKVQSTVKSRADGGSRLDSVETQPGGPARTASLAKVNDENKTRAIAEANAAEEAREAARRAEEEERANAEIDALAEEEARVAALVRERAERKAKANAEIERRAAEQARLAAVSITKARKDAKSVRTEEASHLQQPTGAVAEPTTSAAAVDRVTSAGDPAHTKLGNDAARRTHVTDTRATENATKTTDSTLLKKTWSSLSSTRRVWHYTCEGDRLGPVSLEELKKRAADSLLDPRLDMVWKKGMDEWTPAGRIEGLFERLDPQPETRQPLAKPTVPLQPTQRISSTQTRMKLTWPGARRRSLLLATLVFPIVWKIVLVAISPLLTRQFGIILMEKILPLAALVPLAVVVHFGLKRLINLGMSRWWLLAACVPGLNLWLGYRCFACPPGFACHKKLDGPGIALAALYWSAMAAAIWMLVFKPAKLVDLVGSPLLLQQLRSAILKN